MTECRFEIPLAGKIVAMFLDEDVEQLICLRLCDGDGLYPSILYREVQYNQLEPEYRGRIVLSVRELTVTELCEPEHAQLLARICRDLGEKDGGGVCSRMKRCGGFLFLHTLDGGGEAIVWSSPPIIHYAQPRQIYFWDVGLTNERAYIRMDSSPMSDYFQPWRTDSFTLHPHGSDHRLYGGVRILDAAQTSYTLRLTVEDGLHRSHRVIYKNLAWSGITNGMAGIPLTLVREISVKELMDGAHETPVRGYLKEHQGVIPDLSGDLSDYMNSGYKLYLHETGDPDTEFLVIAGYIHMT